MSAIMPRIAPIDGVSGPHFEEQDLDQRLSGDRNKFSLKGTVQAVQESTDRVDGRLEAISFVFDEESETKRDLDARFQFAV
jgi:hypothetical protein